MNTGVRMSMPASPPLTASFVPRHFVMLGAVWTAVLCASLLWNQARDEARIWDTAYAEARANLNKDITFRRWATLHGGVYVPITETQQSVPWLAHVPGRDVTTTDGRALTLLNPASMMRQIMDRHKADYGIQGRITGLKWFNPANAPDDWEREQLESFTRGESKEVWQVADINGTPNLRYLRAMFMEPGCEKCHAILGFKQGDMRGATGLNLPLDPYLKQLHDSRLNLGATHATIWLIGLIGLGWTGRLARQRDAERLAREAEKEQANAQIRLYANVFEKSGEAILISDGANRILAVNPALIDHTGYSLEELRGQDPRILASGHTPPEIYVDMWQALNARGYWQGELADRRKDGGVYTKWAAISVIRNDAGVPTHYIASYTDITDRKAAEQRIEYLAHHDSLTGLFNRYNLESRLQQALLGARRENEMLAVLFIDLDRFKVINDTLGHHVGDLLLSEVARRLHLTVRECDIVGRLGGDEFVVVVTGLTASIDVASVAGKLRHALGQPYHIEDRVLHTTPSIGISVFPGNGEDTETLMKHADTAMYHAKEQGRNNVQFFTAALNAAASERLELEVELRNALEQKQFLLHYQPQVSAADGRVCGVEALVRWRHPERGLIPPLKFIPVAEETGMIEAIGAWVLDESCRQLAAWRAAGIEGIRMAVNLSAHQLRAPELIEQVKMTLGRYELQEGDLELEVTESVAMENPERAIGQLHALRALGVHLAIDDFGTGYSSLAYLKLLPIQTLKLDRAFVRDIETDSNDAAISTATLALAHSLGLKVVAEGVETEVQRDFLVRNGCDFLQGYLFSKPEPAEVLSARWHG